MAPSQGGLPPQATPVTCNNPFHPPPSLRSHSDSKAWETVANWRFPAGLGQGSSSSYASKVA